MLTMNYQALQYWRPKPIKKKKVKARTEHSASTWIDKEEWKKLHKRPKSSRGTTTKASQQKAVRSKEKYLEELQHPLWTKKRNSILNRDHHQCVLCGSDYNLQVHHTRYSPGKKAWEYPNAALVTLCKDCHEKVHKDLNHELNPYKKNEK